jgi:hypothetical protein
MKREVRTALAVGALVVAEAALGVMLFVRGSDVGPNNPWRVGDGFPTPPDCSLMNRSQVDKVLTDANSQLTDMAFHEDDDPVRRCVFQPSNVYLGSLEVTMRSRVIGRGGPLEIFHPGPSELNLSDNLTTVEVKRTVDAVHATFTVDNLDVLVYYSVPARHPGFLGEQQVRRMRDSTAALARDMLAKLAIRNRTTPSPTPR